MLQLIGLFLSAVSGFAFWYFQWKRQQRDLECQHNLLVHLEEAHIRLKILEEEIAINWEFMLKELTTVPDETREPAEVPQINLDAKRKITKGETEWKN